MFANETETRKKIIISMNLLSENILLDCHSHEPACGRQEWNLLVKKIWIPVFTGMTNNKSKLEIDLLSGVCIS